MKVFDRYLGCEVALPTEVEPGRFRLLDASVLNGDVVLSKNDILVTDGRERCVIGSSACTFSKDVFRFPDAHDLATRDAVQSIVGRSVAILAAQMKSNRTKLPSPLLPQEMADEMELNELDKALREVIERGHLDEIARRPRHSMKYEAELVDVSRVRRTAPGALNRLASRSEDWHRRTLSGVLPKRLLAMLSEDDWSIYENTVIARLIDRLDEYLRRRLAEAEELRRAYSEALELNEAEDIDYRLRAKLCHLWGETTASSSRGTERAIADSEDVIETLGIAKRKIGMLRQSELYSRVPRAARVPAELRHTNILGHDHHYRHLRTLWHLHQKRNAEQKQTPAERFMVNLRELEDFSHYLQMIVRRVLKSIRQIDMAIDATEAKFNFGGVLGSVTAEAAEIIVGLADRALVVVPAVGTVPQITEMNSDGSGRLIVSSISIANDAPFSGFETVGTGRVLSINPLDFYGEEKLRLVIERFLWLPMFQSYGEWLQRLPARSLEWLKNHRIGIVQKSSWCLRAPLDGATRRQLVAWLPGSGLNEETQKEVLVTAQRLTALGHCRHCGAEARFINRDNGFKAECGDCNTEWGIYSSASGRVARMMTENASCRDFRRLGSWFMEFAC